MAYKLRILAASNRTMQRLGFLKPLCALATRTDTSNLPALGGQLIAMVSTRLRIEPPYAQALRDYVNFRLFDRIYSDLRKSALSKTPAPIALESQDIYLADERVPSSTGKLVEKNWKTYPPLATSIDLIKLGTYSALTRAQVLLALTPKAEIVAFEKLDPGNNPFLLNSEQAALLLYCMVDNDAEVIHPLFARTLELANPTFDERIAGDELPAILRAAIKSSERAALSHEARERLSQLAKIMANIEAWKGKPATHGSGAREESVRSRLEPYCDLGLFTKPERHRFSYKPTQAMRILLANWSGTDKTDEFLCDRFFTTLAAIHGINAEQASPDEARRALLAGSEPLKSPVGYMPITDLALLAGIHLLFRNRRLLEIRQADSLLVTWQKEDPALVRFTVDRMGQRAFVKFVAPTPAAAATPTSAK
jgi:hypothetical protein